MSVDLVSVTVVAPPHSVTETVPRSEYLARMEGTTSAASLRVLTHVDAVMLADPDLIRRWRRSDGNGGGNGTP